MKIGVIADDLTGANDVGVQFFKNGFPVITFLGLDEFLSTSEKQHKFFHKQIVAIIDSESRFNSPSTAYKKVRTIAKFFKEKKIGKIYKKLDSTLRGNIGSEIDALLDEFEVSFIPVIPAFPEMGRITLNGLHYVDGILLEKSEYARDPNNPVKKSYLPELINSRYKTAHINKDIISKGTNSVLQEIKNSIKSKVKIISFDAVLNKDIDVLASALKSEKIVCGAAGLASRLAYYWKKEFNIDKHKLKVEVPIKNSHILGVIGSVKETTREQVDSVKNYATVKNYIFKYRNFSSAARCNNLGQSQLFTIIKKILNKKDVFLYSGSKIVAAVPPGDKKYTSQISNELGNLTKVIIKNTNIDKLILSGGDIAIKVCKKLGIKCMVILSEVLTGVPLVLGIARKKSFLIVTKPGGFGDRNAFKIILDKLKKFKQILLIIIWSSQCYSGTNSYYEFYTGGYISRNMYEIPRNIRVITSDEIEVVNARNLGEALEKNGVFVKSFGSFGSHSNASSRGFNETNLLVLLDGRSINDPKSSAIDLNEIPLEIIDRIEIINGSVSSVYGNAGVSGCINIITKDTKRKITNLQGSYGSFNTQIYRITASNEFLDFQHLLAGNVSLTDGSRSNSYDAKNLSGKFQYKFSDNIDINLLGIYYNNNRNLPGKIDAITPAANEKKEKGYIDLELNTRFSYASSVRTKLYGNMTKYKEKPFETVLQYNTDDISTLGTNIVYILELGSLNIFSGGVNVYQNKLLSQNKLLDKTEDYKETVTAVFMQNQTNLLQFLYVDINMRHEYSSLFGSVFSPSLNVKYPFSTRTSIIGSIGKSFRTPTFEEISVLQEAKTEKAINYEVGFEQIFSSANIKINLFRYDIDNFHHSKEQIKASMNGIEFNTEVFPFKGFRVGSIYTYTDPKNKDKDEVLRDTKKHSFNLNLTHKTDFGLTTYLYGEYFETYSDILLSGSWSKTGLKLTQQFTRLISVFVAVDNLLNKEYEIIQRYPMPGREIYGGINIKF